jgi:hypothetical protein
MYYPYLRGKQFELLALREFATSNVAACLVFPIIEPVKSSFNSMKLAIKKLNETHTSFALILNPRKGELVGKFETVLAELNEVLVGANWTPAYIVDYRNSKGISEHITEMNYTSAMIICDESVDTNNSAFKQLLEMHQVSKVVFSDNNRAFKRELSKLQKEAIRIDDKFNAQKRNSDYVNIPEEQFSEEVFYYKEDNFAGFSDYTVLSSEYIDGGMLPKALAIHFTFQKNKEIWIRHFVSDTNDDNSNIQGKFAEAAVKAIAFFESLSYTNNAIEELKRYYNTEQYPGLGVLKKLSIKSHLELINMILTQQAE